MTPCLSLYRVSYEMFSKCHIDHFQNEKKFCIWSVVFHLVQHSIMAGYWFPERLIIILKLYQNNRSFVQPNALPSENLLCFQFVQSWKVWKLIYCTWKKHYNGDKIQEIQAILLLKEYYLTSNLVWEKQIRILSTKIIFVMKLISE